MLYGMGHCANRLAIILIVNNIIRLVQIYSPYALNSQVRYLVQPEMLAYPAILKSAESHYQDVSLPTFLVDFLFPFKGESLR